VEGGALVAIAPLVGAETAEILHGFRSNVGPEHNYDSAQRVFSSCDVQIHLRIFLCLLGRRLSSL